MFNHFEHKQHLPPDGSTIFFPSPPPVPSSALLCNRPFIASAHYGQHFDNGICMEYVQMCQLNSNKCRASCNLAHAHIRLQRRRRCTQHERKSGRRKRAGTEWKTDEKCTVIVCVSDNRNLAKQQRKNAMCECTRCEERKMMRATGKFCAWRCAAQIHDYFIYI